MKPRYLINAFYFQYDFLKKELGEVFDFTFTPTPRDHSEPAWKYVPRNFLEFRKLYRSGGMNAYDIVHLNRVEGLLAYKKIPNQLSIFEIHGFDIGTAGKNYLKDLHTPWKKILGAVLDFLISPLVLKKLKAIDIFYVSTPDLVLPIEKWSGRKPVWLPNPINLDLFSPAGPKTKLHGSPACFLAARLHGDKNPEVAFSIFQNHILPAYPKAVLHLIDTGELAREYHAKYDGDSRYVWHGYMDKPTIASVIRGSDLVFGDFAIGALSLLPMQVMAAKRPIVTLDRYETVLKTLDEMPEYALRLLGDIAFREAEIERNHSYVHSHHAPASAAAIHLKIVESFRP